MVRRYFPNPYTKDAAAVWPSKCAAQEPETNEAIADDNELIDIIGLKLNNDVFVHNEEIGYWLGKPFWGRKLQPEHLKNLERLCLTVLILLESLLEYLKAILRKQILSKANF